MKNKESALTRQVLFEKTKSNLFIPENIYLTSLNTEISFKKYELNITFSCDSLKDLFNLSEQFHKLK